MNEWVSNSDNLYLLHRSGKALIPPATSLYESLARENHGPNHRFVPVSVNDPKPMSLVDATA